MPQTRSLRTAMAAIAIALPEEQGKAVSHAYDEGRAAERILVGATMLGLGAGIAWILAAARGTVGELLHVPGEWRVRTVVAIGHPSEAARRPSQPRAGAAAPATRWSSTSGGRRVAWINSPHQRGPAWNQAANPSSRRARRSGPQLDIELVSSNARIGGSINLGAYSRLSDLLNFHDEILTVAAGAVMNPLGESGHPTWGCRSTSGSPS